MSGVHHQHSTASSRKKKTVRSPASPPTLRAMSGRVRHGPSPAGPNLSVPCPEEKWDPSSSTFPGRSLEVLNGLQKAVARRVFSDYLPAGWEWISAETATSLLRTMPLASPCAPENLARIARDKRKNLSPCLVLWSSSGRLWPKLGL